MIKRWIYKLLDRKDKTVPLSLIVSMLYIMERNIEILKHEERECEGEISGYEQAKEVVLYQLQRYDLKLKNKAYFDLSMMKVASDIITKLNEHGKPLDGETIKFAPFNPFVNKDEE